MSAAYRIFEFTDMVLNYLTLQLVRCAAASVLLMTVIMLLRIFLRKTAFLKGLLWSLLILSPFFGKLKAYYEINALSKVSWKWIVCCMNYHWISWLYFSGIVCMTLHTIRSRRSLGLFVIGMDKMQVCGTMVFVCPLKITPFTTGIFQPKIVIPEFMVGTYSEDELKTVLTHEMTHIRFRHLFLYLLWDILHIILWINPLFAVCLKYFKQDMEDICDRAAIQKLGGDGYKYGSVLVKSLEFLQDRATTNDAGLLHADIPVAFAGESPFLHIKQRIVKVVGFKEYKKSVVRTMSVVSALTVIIAIGILAVNSYARYQYDERVFIFSRTGEKVLVNDCEQLRETVSYDDDYVYVDTEEFMGILEAGKIPVQTFAVSFGGYHKLPGYGVGGYCEFLEPEMLEVVDGRTAKIPYISKKDLFSRIFKYL